MIIFSNKPASLFSLVFLTIFLQGCISFSPPEVSPILNSDKSITLKEELVVEYLSKKDFLPAGQYRLIGESSEGEFYMTESGTTFMYDPILKRERRQGGIYRHFDMDTAPTVSLSGKNLSTSGFYTWTISRESVLTYPIAVSHSTAGKFFVWLPIEKELIRQMEFSP